MYKLIAIWSPPRPEEQQAFEEAYVERHLALAAKVPGLRKLVATRTDTGLEGAAPAFYRVAEMVFDSAESLQRAEHTAEWTELRADAGQLIERFGVSLTVGMGSAQEVPVADTAGA